MDSLWPFQSPFQSHVLCIMIIAPECDMVVNHSVLRLGRRGELAGGPMCTVASGESVHDLGSCRCSNAGNPRILLRHAWFACACRTRVRRPLPGCRTRGHPRRILQRTLVYFEMFEGAWCSCCPADEDPAGSACEALARKG